MELRMYQIPQQLINATLQYLASRPYGEVVKLISALQQLKPVEAKPKKESK